MSTPDRYGRSSVRPQITVPLAMTEKIVRIMEEYDSRSAPNNTHIPPVVAAVSQQGTSQASGFPASAGANQLNAVRSSQVAGAAMPGSSDIQVVENTARSKNTGNTGNRSDVGESSRDC